MQRWWILAPALHYVRGVIRTGHFAVLGLSAAACAIGCGRSTVFECVVGVSPTSLDFGSTPFGTPVSRSVMVSALYDNGCSVSGITLGAGSDPGFAVEGTGSLGVEPDTEMPIIVTFTPASPAPHASGSLVFQTSDPDRPTFSIPLSATVLACDLSAPDAGVDFGTVTIGDPATQQLPVTNLGLVTCNLTTAVSSTSDPGFSLPGSQPTSLSLAPGATTALSVQFEAGAIDPPDVRTGELTITSNDPQTPMITTPLMATLPVCMLGVIPPALDFGNINLNGTATDQVVLVNDGGADCNVSGLALATGSDPDFSLPPQPTTFTVAPGQQADVSVTFSDLSGATPPFLRTGTLDFNTGDPANPTAQVPLEAYVNVACVIASQWVYTVDASGRFARFDPATLTFTDIGVLDCPDSSGPFSMAVDQNAVAWVLYFSGELFQVDTTTAACQPTSFAPDQSGIQLFGMSFVFQPTTGIDTLYVVGAGSGFQTSDDLATISFPSLLLTPIAPVSIGGGELAGTGDGELWDFMPNSPEGVILAQLDPATAAVLSIIPLPNVQSGNSFATKFWGGSFWIFVDNQVYQVPRATGVASLAIADDGYEIVGAGVSTCAPVQ
jgi:hypothetical protein